MVKVFCLFVFSTTAQVQSSVLSRDLHGTKITFLEKKVFCWTYPNKRDFVVCFFVIICAAVLEQAM